MCVTRGATRARNAAPGDSAGLQPVPCPRRASRGIEPKAHGFDRVHALKSSVSTESATCQRPVESRRSRPCTPEAGHRCGSKRPSRSPIVRPLISATAPPSERFTRSSRSRSGGATRTLSGVAANSSSVPSTSRKRHQEESAITSSASNRVSAAIRGARGEIGRSPSRDHRRRSYGLRRSPVSLE